MGPIDYWRDCVSEAAEECGATLTSEQLESMADFVMGGHECYGQAFYAPPDSDRIAEIENGWRRKLAALQDEFDAYIRAAASAAKTHYRVHHDDPIALNVESHEWERIPR